MRIKDYKENDIRDKIISKIKPVIKPGKSKHQKGYIYHDGKLITKVKIPNNHTRLMKHSKSQYIASALRLSPADFNDLIDCPLSGPEYYNKLSKAMKN